MTPMAANALPLLALLLAPTTQAFMTTISSCGASSPFHLRHRSTSSPLKACLSPSTAQRSSIKPSSPNPTVSFEMATDADNSGAAAEPAVGTLDETVTKLRETAAAFRAEAAELESKRLRERREGADRAFAAFDTNKDGTVDLQELQAGLEGPLRRSFIKKLTTRMGRRPTPDEVEARIAELPGGSLLPDDLARKLIAMYDENRDGVLQLSEFAPTEELRSRLEGMFREQREQEREARKAEMEREMAEKAASKGGSGSGGAKRSMGGVNDGAATASERALSALPYLLPLSDGLAYAGHLFASYPDQTALLQPLAVVLLGLRSLPFATLIVFFGMSILSNNLSINKLVRYNMKQAINFDIALIAPGLLGALSSASLGKDAYKLVPFTQVGSDVIFVTLLLAVAYSVGSSAIGEFPNKIPFFGRINRENPDQEGR